MQLSEFPVLNATLNGSSAIFLLLGYFFIMRRLVRPHIFCMVCAAVVSTVFLGCYLYYHYHHGATKYPHHDWTRPVYFTILITHTILAAANLPLIIRTLWFAITGNFDKHKKIARLVFPIWLYVGITGVVVYVLLYQIYPGR